MRVFFLKILYYRSHNSSFREFYLTSRYLTAGGPQTTAGEPDTAHQGCLPSPTRPPPTAGSASSCSSGQHTTFSPYMGSTPGAIHWPTASGAVQPRDQAAQAGRWGTCTPGQRRTYHQGPPPQVPPAHSPCSGPTRGKFRPIAMLRLHMPRSLAGGVPVVARGGLPPQQSEGQ